MDPKLLSKQWNEASAGLHRRPMGENEQFISLIGDRSHAEGREQWSITARASFSLDLESPQCQPGSIDWGLCLRNSWKLLRFQHPSIACRSTGGHELEYAVPNPESLIRWLDESYFVVTEPQVSASSLIATFKPHPYARLYYLAASSEVIIHTAHWRMDGYGAFQLLDALFDTVAVVLSSSNFEVTSPQWGEEVSRLVPSIEEILDLPLEASPEIETIAMEYLATARHLVGTVGLLQQGDIHTNPQGTRHVQVSFSEGDTKSLELACRNSGTSLYSAVHSAVAEVNFSQPESRDGPPGRHHTSTIRLNLRPHLPAPWNTPAVASGLYTGGYMFKVQAGRSLVERSKQYDAEYDSGVSETFLLARRRYARLALDIVRSTPSATMISNMDVSFIRDADQIVRARRETGLGILKVGSLGLGVETLTRQTYCFYWVFDGQLQLSLWYNESYYSAEFAAKILEQLCTTLLEFGH